MYNITSEPQYKLWTLVDNDIHQLQQIYRIVAEAVYLLPFSFLLSFAVKINLL